MQMRWLLAALLMVFLPLDAARADAPPYPPVSLLPEPHRGEHLQNVLRLLAISNQDGWTPVRILFYGQSITEQRWSGAVADYLRQVYPKANLIIENRAIGGHASQRLVKTAEADLYPFQPDLVIFHVYGSHREYEQIIRSIRERTTADILMATDHITLDQELNENTAARQRVPSPLDAVLRPIYRLAGVDPLTTADFPNWMNYTFLPSIAHRYGAELAEVRMQWKHYLQVNHLKAGALLRDGLHLNAHGEYLYAEIIKPYLAPRMTATAAAADPRVRELVPDSAAVSHGVWTVRFQGNRIDGIVGAPPGKPLKIWIDGKAPSLHQETWIFSRASAYPGSNWPGLLRVERAGAPLLMEEWSVIIRDEDPELKQFSFDLAGSRSGTDGSGVSGRKFTSRSRRILIDPADWNLAYAREVIGPPPPIPLRFTWRAAPQGIDVFRPTSGSSFPAQQMLVSGLSDGDHTLRLRGDIRSISMVKVYHPSAR